MIGRETTVRATEHELRLDYADILALLQKAGLVKSQAVTVTVRVPGGGDWSNTDLEISPETPLIVRWRTNERKENRTR